MVGIALVIFAVLNVAAHYHLKSHPKDASELGLFVHRNDPEGLALRSRIFGTNDVDLLIAYGRSPGIRPHPVLHFGEGESLPHYAVGIEGVRYLPGWSDDRVAELLHDKRSVWVFGGSTTFGHGVPDGQTVVAHLDALDPHDTYLNLSVQAYDSIREIDKLLYLLRKGYRPKRVIFVDGLNDVTTFARSPYGVHDAPRTQGLVLDRGEVPLVFGYPKPENMLLAFAYAFPVTHVALDWLGPDPEPGPTGSQVASLRGRDDWQQLMRSHYDWARIHAADPEPLARDVVRYYEEAISFVETLARGFEFSAEFVYQPIGLLETGQPFLTDKFRTSDQLVVYRGVDRRVRQGIASGRLSMSDCSRAIAARGVADGYVDATHYSPQGGRRLAACILAGRAR